MKKSDIKVGQRLAYSRSNDYARYGNAEEVEVLELNVHQPGSFSSPSFDGTKVKSVKTGRVEIVRNSRLKEEWATYAAGQARMRRAKIDAANAKAAARRGRLLKAFDAHTALVAAGFPTHEEAVYDRDEAKDYEAAGFTLTGRDHDRFSYVATPINLRDYVEFGKRPVVSAFDAVDTLAVKA